MHKIALQFGPLTLHWYGVMVALGFLAGLWTAGRRGLRHNLSPEATMDFGPWALAGAIVGARCLFVISYWREDFAQAPWYEMFMIQKGGLVFYGGLIGASLVTILYARWKKLPLWKFADALAPSIALGYVFGRIGCLMNGCCYGQPTDLPWAIHFPIGHETHGTGVHPSQLYESLLNLVLYGALAWAYRRKKFDGQIFALYLVAYACLRSVLELFRGDYGDKLVSAHVTPAHLISLGIFIAGAFLYYWQSAAAKTASAKVKSPPSAGR